MKIYRVMEHSPIKNYSFPFYIEVAERGLSGTTWLFGTKWKLLAQDAAFATREEAFRYIERSAEAEKITAERMRAAPREVVQGYVASDGVFHPLASE